MLIYFFVLDDLLASKVSNIVMKIIVCEKLLELYTKLSIKGVWEFLLSTSGSKLYHTSVRFDSVYTLFFSQTILKKLV